MVKVDINNPSPELLTTLRSRYMRNLAEELCQVQPINPATNDNILNWSSTKQIFENNAHFRWEDDGGACHVN